ncbi:MAG: Transcriptional regulator, AraC family [Myxococcales bacterium]|nr:Transcriptional regulator, AraC family [Myxococcales bacterium]
MVNHGDPLRDRDAGGSHGCEIESSIRLIDSRTGRSSATATGAAVILTSKAQRTWRSPLIFEVHRMASHEYDEHTTVGHQLMINLGGSVRFGWLEGERRHESVLRPEHICIQSDGDSNAPRWRGELLFATASIEPSMIDALLGDRAPPTTEVFPKVHCVPGATAAAFARGLAKELASPTEPLYAETLSLAFVLHLVADYGRMSRHKHLAPKGKLDAVQLRTVIDVAHEHLASDLTLPMLAGAIGYSPFQFARLFKATTGRAPHQFVLSLRLERARRLLAAEVNLAAVALATGFYDQAHFTNAFRKAHGMTPTAYMSRRQSE